MATGRVCVDIRLLYFILYTHTRAHRGGNEIKYEYKKRTPYTRQPYVHQFYSLPLADWIKQEWIQKKNKMVH